MCLVKVKKLNKYDHIKRKGYKIVVHNEKTVRRWRSGGGCYRGYHEYVPILCLQSWGMSKEIEQDQTYSLGENDFPIITANDGSWYPAGFHILKTLSDARKFVKARRISHRDICIHEVIYKDVMCIGSEYGATIVIAKEYTLGDRVCSTLELPTFVNRKKKTNANSNRRRSRKV